MGLTYAWQVYCDEREDQRLGPMVKWKSRNMEDQLVFRVACAGRPAEVGYRQSYRGMQRSPPEPRSCNVIGRRANEWAEGVREERSPKHDKIRTSDSPHKPEMLVVFGQSTASQPKSLSSPRSSSSSPPSSRLVVNGLLTS